MDRISRIIERVKQGFVSCAELFRTPTFAIKVNDVDLIPPYQGWELVEDVKEPSGIVTLEIVSFVELEDRNPAPEATFFFLGDYDILQILKTKQTLLGERTLRALYAARGHIPEEWCEGYIFSPGTVWKTPNGHLRIPVMGYDRGEWYWGYEYLNNCELGSDMGGIMFNKSESHILRRVAAHPKQNRSEK